MSSDTTPRPDRRETLLGWSALGGSALAVLAWAACCVLPIALSLAGLSLAGTSLVAGQRQWITLGAAVLLAAGQSLWLAAVGFLLVAIGLGLSATGFAAAASLGVGPRHQGLVAGFVCATTGLAVLAGTTLSGLLYDLEPIVPVIAAGLAAALAWVLSLPRLAPRVPESVA